MLGVRPTPLHSADTGELAAEAMAVSGPEEVV
jgi:hypothetical protein